MAADFERTAGLRASLPRLDAPERAATELILWHEYWLRRADFTRECVRTAGSFMVIAWSKTGGFIAKNPRCSSSELAVLQLAEFIAIDPFRLRNLGYAHKRAVAEAFAMGCDVRLEPPIPEVGHSHPDFIPGDPATCQRCALDAPDEGHPMPGTVRGSDDE